MDAKIISFRSPHLILAGVGSLERLPEEAKSLEAKKALVVTDRGVIDSGVGEKVRALLKSGGIPAIIQKATTIQGGGQLWP